MFGHSATRKLLHLLRTSLVYKQRDNQFQNFYKKKNKQKQKQKKHHKFVGNFIRILRHFQFINDMHLTDNTALELLTFPVYLNDNDDSHYALHQSTIFFLS